MFDQSSNMPALMFVPGLCSIIKVPTWWKVMLEHIVLERKELVTKQHFNTL